MYKGVVLPIGVRPLYYTVKVFKFNVLPPKLKSDMIMRWVDRLKVQGV